MLRERRWLLSIVLCVTLSVTMLWTPAFALAADNSGGQPAENTFINSDGTRVHVSKDGFVYRYIGYKHGRDRSADYDDEGNIPEGDVAIRIIGYCGTDAKVVIPDKIDGYDVTEVYWNKEEPSGMEDEIDYDTITEIHIPATVKGYKCLYSKAMQRFVVDPANENYCVENGALCSKWTHYNKQEKKNVTELSIVEYPFSSITKTITIPKGVYSFGLEVFQNADIETINVPSSVSWIGFNDTIDSLTAINVEEGAESIYSINGVLFTQEDQGNGLEKTLYYYPQKRSGESYSVPKGTTRIYCEFGGTEVKKVVIPASVAEINMEGFLDSSVEEIIFEGKKAPEVWNKNVIKDQNIKIDYPEDGTGYEDILKMNEKEYNYWEEDYFDAAWDSMHIGDSIDFYANYKAYKGNVIYEYAPADEETGNEPDESEYSTTFPSKPGNYYFKAVVKETDSYEGLVDGPYSFELLAEGDKPLENRIKISSDYYDYDGQEHGVEAKALHGDSSAIVIEYAPCQYDDSIEDYTRTGEYTSKKPKDAGEYIARAVIKGTDEYQGAEDTVHFTIYQLGNRWTEKLSCPSVEKGQPIEPKAKAEYGTDTVKFIYSDTHSGEYTDKVPTEIGKHFVKAVVDETNNYAGLMSIPVKFMITKKSNEWTEALACSSIEVCETPAPHAKAKFGDAVKYLYSDSENGEYTDAVPNTVGDYFVKAVVEEGSDYEGLESAPVKFTIKQKAEEPGQQEAGTKPQPQKPTPAPAPTVKKKANTMKVVFKNKTFKAKKLKKKKLSYKAVTVKTAKGQVVYTAKPMNKKAKKALKFNRKTGKITVKKKTKKGTYRMKITVQAKGNKQFNASKKFSKVIKVKVR